MAPLRTHVIDDHGPVGRGASLAHSVLAENGNEYIIKGPSFTPGHSFVAANELIAAQLAGELALPILDYCIVEMGGGLYSGSTYMPTGSFHPQTTEALFAACLNAERAYDIVAFDTFLCNVDRHHENLLVRTNRVRGSSVDKHLLLLNDHSHCLVLPGESASSLPRLMGTGPDRYVTLPFLRDRIVDPQRLSTSIGSIEGIGDQMLGDAVRGLPSDFFPGGGVQEYIGFLTQRRDALRVLFESNRAVFGNLGGGPIA